MFQEDSVNSRPHIKWEDMMVGTKTSREWYDQMAEIYDLEIVKSTGWRTGDIRYSFDIELITRGEFLRRLNKSTISCDPSFFMREYREEQRAEKKRKAGDSILKPQQKYKLRF